MSYFNSSKGGGLEPIVNRSLGAFSRGPRKAFSGIFDDTDDAIMSFNSSSFPGICKPMDKTTLDTVVKFQKNLNRVAQAKGFSKIAPDGDIGPATLTLFRQVQASSSGQISGNGQSCTGIGSDLVHINREVLAFAEAIGAPTTVANPTPAKPPSFITPSGQLNVVPNAGAASISDVVKNMSTPMKLAMGGISLGIGYFLFFAPVGKRKK